MISDPVSISILSRDLFHVYARLLNRRLPTLPNPLVQFPDYAFWQRNAGRPWIEQQGAYWAQRLQQPRVSFPSDLISTGVSVSGWGTVAIHIDRTLKDELQEWSRQRHTTLAMTVFVAYVALVSRWCKVSEVTVQYVSDGRINPDTQSTIGYFAFELFPTIELHDDDTFLDLLQRVTKEYCKAFEHADYAFMAAQVPRPGFARNTAFNWIPRGSSIEDHDLEELGRTLTFESVYFDHPMLAGLRTDNEPSIVLHETESEIVGGMYFPLWRFSVDGMRRFTSNVLEFIQTIQCRPQTRVKDVVLL